MIHPNPLQYSSSIVLGTSGFGTDLPEESAYRLLDHYVHAGGNHIDTAFDYASWVPDGAGASEKTIGHWLSLSGMRNEIIIASKAGCTQGDVKRVRREILREEIEISLQRLGTDHLDIFWLHRDDPAVPVDEILDWVEELRREKRFTLCGASNWTTARLAEARACSSRKGVPGFAASQCGWNLATLSANDFPTGDACFLQSSDERWHRETNLPLVAFESQAGGFFSGRYDASTKPGSSRGYVVMLHYANEQNWKRLELVKELAVRHGATPNQVALAWMRQQAFPVFPIIGPRTLEQLQDSMGAQSLCLSPMELQLLRSGSNLA